MQKKEQQFQSKFNKYIRQEVLPKIKAGFFIYELKHTRGRNSLPYSDLKLHQEQALLAAKSNGFVYKIDDSSYGQKPFDCFALKGVPAYIVIYFAKSKKFYGIDIANFVFYRDVKSNRKSITEQEAYNISSFEGNFFKISKKL